jgi:rhomboid family GlyGly-CTERM serine protease
LSGTTWGQDGRAWLALAALLGGSSLLAWWLPSPPIDWQPERALLDPWRAFTGAVVHWSAQHLLSNLAGAAVVAALGVVGRLPPAAALAWLAAWPLTQLGLLVQPALAHYGGLSGVLHAGVAVATLWLLVRARGRERTVAGLLLCGLLTKVVLEEPWGSPLRSSSGWDIAIAPLAHASGTACGLLSAALALALTSARPSPGVDRADRPRR